MEWERRSLSSEPMQTSLARPPSARKGGRMGEAVARALGKNAQEACEPSPRGRMRWRNLDRVCALFLGNEGENGSSTERFAIPFSFTPQLKFTAALVATVGALLRILLGSALFAIWATYSLVAWTAISSPLSRVGALLTLLLLFLLSSALLMLAIAALVRAISPRQR